MSDYFGAGLNNGDINGSYHKIGRMHSGSLPRGIGVIHSNVESSYALQKESKERIHDSMMEDKLIMPNNNSMALSSGGSPAASMTNVIVLKKDGKTAKTSRNTRLSQYLKTLNNTSSPRQKNPDLVVRNSFNRTQKVGNKINVTLMGSNSPFGRKNNTK